MSRFPGSVIVLGVLSVNAEFQASLDFADWGTRADGGPAGPQEFSLTTSPISPWRCILASR